MITPAQITQNKENPLKIKDSSYFPAYPNQILPNIAILNHILTISSRKPSYNSRLFHTNSGISFFRIELFTESIFIPFHIKKEAIAETMTSNLFHPIQRSFRFSFDLQLIIPPVIDFLMHPFHIIFNLTY